MTRRRLLGWAARALVAIGAGVAAYYGGAIVLLGAIFAHDTSRWQTVYVYESGTTTNATSDYSYVDVYAQPPFGALDWLFYSAFVVAAWAIAVWGVWLVARMALGGRGRLAPGRRRSTPTRIATQVFAWGIVALSVYALAVYLWDWLEWRDVLDSGLTLPGDPKPEPNPEYDAWQIPLGAAMFAAIAALPFVVRTMMRRRASRRG